MTCVNFCCMNNVFSLLHLMGCVFYYFSTFGDMAQSRIHSRESLIGFLDLEAAVVVQLVTWGI